MVRAQPSGARAQPPTHRPTWVTILSSLMLIYAGLSLVFGLMKLRRPTMVLEGGVPQVVDSEETMKIRQRLSAARAAAVQPHERAVRIEAAAEILVSLLALYAAAALLARDRHGRTLTLTAAGLGIAYQVGTLLVYLPLLRAYAELGGDPRLALIANAAELEPRSADQVAGQLAGGLIMATAVVVVGAFVVIAYFGGRRGRALYGLTPPPALKRSSQ
jgi:hypothetical protein